MLKPQCSNLWVALQGDDKMAAITLATVRTNAFTEIFDTLQTDNAITSNNIHSSYNNKQTIKEGYPQIIVNEPDVQFVKIGMGGVNSNNITALYRIPFRIRIDVYEDSAADVKTVADEVTEKIIGFRDTLRTSNIWNIQFDFDDHEVVEYHQDKSIHIYHLFFTAIFMANG